MLCYQKVDCVWLGGHMIRACFQGIILGFFVKEFLQPGESNVGSGNYAENSQYNLPGYIGLA